MPAKDVKAYVKRNKNDAADAEASAERMSKLGTTRSSLDPGRKSRRFERRVPRNRRAAKRGNKFSASDVDCHVTLPCGSCPFNGEDNVTLYHARSDSARMLSVPSPLVAALI